MRRPTYVPTEEGRLYLATVIDIASRRVAGWATADHLRTELVANALTAACRQRRPTDPVIFHSDRGRQFTSQQSAAAQKLPSPPKPSGDDLKPFPGHWSPCGPRSY